MEFVLPLCVFLVTISLMIIGHVLEKQLTRLNKRLESLTDKLEGRSQHTAD